jgi:hypothetical protein
MKSVGWFLCIVVVTLLCCTAICHAKDSVSVNVAPQRQGAITMKLIAYDGEQIVRGWEVSAGGIVTVRSPAELMPYFIPDTSAKNMPPFMSNVLTYTRAQMGKDTTWIDSITKHLTVKMKAKLPK